MKINQAGRVRLRVRVRVNKKFNGGRKEIIIKAKYGKNELCNSTWHIRNSIVWYTASKATITIAILLNLFFSANIKRLNKRRNSRQAIRSDTVPFQCSNIHIHFISKNNNTFQH